MILFICVQNLDLLMQKGTHFFYHVSVGSYFYPLLNNNGNFISVFKGIIVNLATCRQFTNWLLEIELFKKKILKNEIKKNQNRIKSWLSQFLFLHK